VFLAEANVRGIGGYIVAPPSVHPSGTTYTWLDCDGLVPDGPCADAPPEIVAALAAHPTDNGKFALPAIVQTGTRDNTLYRLAASLRASGCGEIEIRAGLAAANMRCSPPMAENDLDRITKSILSKPAGLSPAYAARALELVVDESSDNVGNRAPRKAGNAKTFMRNDTGNADRLVDAHGDDLMFSEQRESFAVWDGKRWKLDRYILVSRQAESVIRACFAEAGKIADADKRKAFLGFLNKSLSRAGIGNMIEVAKRKLRQISASEFDSCDELLNFQNGTLDLRTGQLRKHRRDDLITKILPYEFDAAATCPTFLKFLGRIMGDKPNASTQEKERAERLILFLQRSLGFAITGLPGKVLFLWWGGGNNGKTTLAEIIRCALGGNQYAGQLQIESLMADQRQAAGNNAIGADIADLQGVRFVVASEPEAGMKFNLSRVKYLTGMGEIKARYLRENPFSFRPSHKLFVDGNHRPLVNNPNDAVWNRIKLVPFSVTIPDDEIDPYLLDKMRAELPGIMNWLAQGAADYLRHGLGDPPEVSAATEGYRADSDRLKEFLEDECIVGPTVWGSVTGMWTAYQDWESSNAVRFPLTKSQFDDRIQRIPGVRKAKKSGGAIRAWEGIAIRAAGQRDKAGQ